MSVNCTMSVWYAFTVTPFRIYTDITADVVGSASLMYGIAGNGPADCVAGIGSFRFQLNNASSNSGGIQGWYSPNHVNCRSGFGMNGYFKVQFAYAGTTYYKFAGRLKVIDPVAGSHDQRWTLCVAEDFMREITAAQISSLATATGKRADELITTAVAACGGGLTNRPVASYDTGKSTFPYAGPATGTNGIINGLQELQRIVSSERGFLYMKGDTVDRTNGLLRFDNRHFRPAVTTNASTFNETMSALYVPSNVEDAINRAQVTVHPMRVDTSSVVLYAIVTSQPLTPQQSITIFGPYRDPAQLAAKVSGTSMIAPVATTDYTANSASDGSGTDLTANITVVATFGANGVSFLVTNTSTTVACYLTTLQCRGLGIYGFVDAVMVKEDGSSQTAVGLHVASVDMAYEADISNGELAAQWIVDQWGVSMNRALLTDRGRFAKTVTISANASAANMVAALAREVGDRIGLVETMTGITTVTSTSYVRGYWIHFVNMQIAEGCQQVDVTYTLAPGDTQAYWILGQVGASELGDTTRLGYF